jgi:raffinose/stachyose/melibiose transport system substrate-binding protein
MAKSKWVKLLAGTAALSLLLTACAGGGSNSGSTSEAPGGSAATAAPAKKEVSFSIIYAIGDPAGKQAMADAVDAFTKANPHIKIQNFSDGGASSYLDFLKTKDAVNEFPDLVEMRDTQLFADAGKLAELPAELHGLFESLPVVNGKYYTAPIAGTAPQGMIYSKKLYAEAGIQSEPKTYAEFLDAMEKLKAKGVSPIAFGGKDIFHWGFWVNKFLIDEVFIKDQDWNSKRTKGQASFTDEGPLKAMQLFSDLFKKGYIDPGFNSTADNQIVSLLVSGKAAGFYSGPWMFGQIQQADPKFEFGFYPVPDEKGKFNVSGLPTQQGWAMSAVAAKDPDKAGAITEFIKFFFSKEQYTKYLKMGNAIPTTKEKVTYEASPQMKEVLDLMADPKTGKAMQINAYWGENQIPPQFRNWFYKLLQEAVTKGDFSVEYMKRADTEYNNQVKAMQK